jgi:tight adherence protein B
LNDRQLIVAGMAAAIAVLALGRLLWTTARRGVRQHHSRLLRLASSDFTELWVFLDPAAFLRLNAIVVLLVPPLVAWLSGSTWVGVMLFGLLLLAPTLIFRRLRRTRSRALLRQLPDAALAIAAGLRAGQGFAQAIELVPRYQPRPIADEFALVLRERRVGLPIEQALHAMADRCVHYEFQMFVATLAIAGNLGGGLAEALERLAGSIRRRVAMDDRIAALTSQGRLQGSIVSALPVLIVIALSAIQPAAISALFATPLGWCTLLVVAMLELVGWLLIRRIVRIDV